MVPEGPYMVPWEFCMVPQDLDKSLGGYGTQIGPAHMGPNGAEWAQTEPNEFKWDPIGASGTKWLLMGKIGLSGPNCFKWYQIGPPQKQWASSLDQTTTPRTAGSKEADDG